MKNKLPGFLLALALASTAPILHAASNADDGKEKVGVCASCHGEQGNSLVAAFPKLAGQHASYLVKQLQAFKKGGRKNAMMAGFAMPLSDDDMADIAAYYAGQKITPNELPVRDEDEEGQAGTQKTVPELIAQGGDLYRNGNLVREVSACIACHGPTGEGNKPAAFPSLKSQHADYLIKSLTDYKMGLRGNNSGNIMQMIAKKMTEEEIKAVAYRISMMP